MGQLRTEPKHKSFLSQEQYDKLLSELQSAKSASEDHHVFYDLEGDEKPAFFKKAFAYVAKKSGMDVKVRQVRGKNSLAFQFKRPRAGVRMSAPESRQRILKCLKSSGEPLKKNQIIKETGVSPSTWNLRINELLDSGSVVRHGQRRDTTYTAA